MLTDKEKLQIARKEIRLLTEQLYVQYTTNKNLRQQVYYLKAKLESCENLLEQLSVIKLK